MTHKLPAALHKSPSMYLLFIGKRSHRLRPTSRFTSGPVFQTAVVVLYRVSSVLRLLFNGWKSYRSGLEEGGNKNELVAFQRKSE